MQLKATRRFARWFVRIVLWMMGFLLANALSIIGFVFGVFGDLAFRPDLRAVLYKFDPIEDLYSHFVVAGVISFLPALGLSVIISRAKALPITVFLITSGLGILHAFVLTVPFLIPLEGVPILMLAGAASGAAFWLLSIDLAIWRIETRSIELVG